MSTYIPKHIEPEPERVDAIRQRLMAERAANAPSQNALQQAQAGTLVSGLWSRIGRFLAQCLGAQRS